MTSRWSSSAPRFALGHGLGWTRVEYTALRLSEERVAAPEATTRHTAAGSGAPGVLVHITVRNAGERPADELVAVWAGAPRLPVPAPRLRLAGWTRVRLAPGETREVALEVPVGVLAVWDAGASLEAASSVTPGAFRVQPGRYRLSSGPSAAALQVSAELDVVGDEPGARRADHLGAHGFHAAHCVETGPRTRERGACIELAPGAEAGWARFDRLDLDGVRTLGLEVARGRLGARGPSTVALDVRRSGGSEWVALTGPVAVPSGLEWRWAETPVRDDASLRSLLAGTVDLRLRLAGAARVAAVRAVR